MDDMAHLTDILLSLVTVPAIVATAFLLSRNNKHLDTYLCIVGSLSVSTGLILLALYLKFRWQWSPPRDIAAPDRILLLNPHTEWLEHFDVLISSGSILFMAGLFLYAIRKTKIH